MTAKEASRKTESTSAAGRGGAANVLFDLTGNVYDPDTGERLGSLTQVGVG